MKDLILKIIFIGIAFLATIFTAAHFFLVFQGKVIISRQLEAVLKKKVTIVSFSITPLFRLGITGLKIEGIGQIEKIYISPSLFGSLIGNLAFSDVQVVNPDLTFEKFPASVNTGAPAAEKPKPAVSENVSVKINEEKINRVNLVFKRFSIQNGKITFFDHTIGDKGIKIIFKDINFKLSNLFIMPRSAITNFDISASIPWLEGQEEGKLKADGWINFYKKDMNAKIKIDDIDGVYLYPFFSGWMGGVSLDKTGIEKAKLYFESNLTALDNNLTAECHLELTDILRKQRSAEEPPEKEERIATAVLDMFKALNQGKVMLDVTIKSKMDRLEFGFKDLRMAFEEKVAQRKASKPEMIGVLLLPAKLVEGTIKGATDISKAMIDGTFAVGNELKNAVKGSFTKQPKEVK